MAKFFSAMILAAALAFTMVTAAPKPQSSGKSDPSFLKRDSLHIRARVDTLSRPPREGVIDANKRVDAQFLKPSATAAP